MYWVPFRHNALSLLYPIITKLSILLQKISQSVYSIYSFWKYTSTFFDFYRFRLYFSRFYAYFSGVSKNPSRRVFRKNLKKYFPAAVLQILCKPKAFYSPASARTKKRRQGNNPETSFFVLKVMHNYQRIRVESKRWSVIICLKIIPRTRAWTNICRRCRGK